MFVCAPGVRLHVRVLGVEQRLRAIDGELLDLVDDLAAAVVAASRVALRVLVRGNAAHGLEHRGPREVLGRDQLDLAPLPLELPADQPGDLGVDVVRAPAARRSSKRQRHGGHRGRCYSSAAADPSERVRGSDRALPEHARLRPVKSSTVEGTPGSSPPSTTAAPSARISAGTSAGRLGSRLACRFALVAVTAPTCSSISAARPLELGDADADRVRPSSREPREAARGVRKHERVRPGKSARTTHGSLSPSSGMHSISESTLATTSAIGCPGAPAV